MKSGSTWYFDDPFDISRILTFVISRYCDHALTPELDAAATELLTELKRFHDRAIAKDPSKAKRRSVLIYGDHYFFFLFMILLKKKNRFVSGLREVLREVKAKSARSVIIAPNIEECKAEGCRLCFHFSLHLRFHLQADWMRPYQRSFEVLDQDRSLWCLR